MNIEFLLDAKDEGRISQKRRFQEDLTTLFKYAKLNGLSTDLQQVIVDVALGLELNDKMFQNLILCMIPKKVVPKGIVDQVISWLFLCCADDLYENKNSCILDWIACLLDHKLIDKEAIDQYYGLFFLDVKKNWRNLTYILYLLTKAEDVTQWRVNIVQECIAMFDQPPHLCVLLKRFKELNPYLVHQTVTVRKTIEQVFCDKNKFYECIRESLARRNITFSSSTSIVPFMKHKNVVNNSQDIILPTVQYMQHDSESQTLNECYIQDIKNGVDMVRKFRKLTLPLDTLSLLNSSIGIHILMMSPTPVQEHFFRNLHCLLEENLIFKRSNYSISKVESLLENVIRLHQIYQQGFTSVSYVLRTFLQCWDGYLYRPQIYKLLEWFVFKSLPELNRYLLLPLHSLFVSADPKEQCDIIICLQNLIKNLYSRMNKGTLKYSNVFEEKNVVNSQEDLIPTIKAITKFTCKLCKLALYFYPCDNQIILVSLMFYDKIQGLEMQHKMRWWTIISLNTVYHCLFSFNAQLLNQMCALWLKYQEMPHFSIDNQAMKIEEKKERLKQFANDVFNTLWTGRAFSERMQGLVFTGLSSADELSWRQHVNLNNSLTLERHIMFSPYRMLHAQKNNSFNKFSKNNMLDVLEDHIPYFHNVILRMVETAEDVSDGEME